MRIGAPGAPAGHRPGEAQQLVPKLLPESSRRERVEAADVEREEHRTGEHRDTLVPVHERVIG